MDRTKIPSKIAAKIIAQFEFMCCVCKKRDKVQIHHIDGIPTNHSEDNLVLLCLEHHDEASKTGGVTRNFTPDVIKEFRSKRLMEIASKEKFDKQFDNPEMDFLIDAMIVFDIKKTEYLIEANRFDYEKILELIKPFRFYGIYHREVAAHALLGACSSALSYARQGLPSELGSAIENIIYEVMPITGGLVGIYERQEFELSKKDLEIFRFACRLGFELVYEGSRYLKNEDLVRQGCRILWAVLRYGILNKKQELIKMSEEHFIDQIEHAEKIFSDIVKFEYEDAKGKYGF